jgi:CheY-like chemotaxis protein
LISGYVSNEVVVRARAVGVTDIISKPNIVEELAATVQRMLAARDAVTAGGSPLPLSSGRTLH